MRALVTGAHGFIGSHLVDRLVAEGAEVRALISPWGNLNNLSGVAKTIDIVRADITDGERLRGVCDGVEVIFHAAARVADYGPAEPFYRVNVTGTENLLREGERAGVKRLVLVSSVAVHHYSGFREADPRTLPRDGRLNAYARSKIAAEDTLKLAGLETVIVRPGLWPFGPRDPNFTRIAHALAKGQLPLVEGGRAVINTAYCENLVEGLWLAGTKVRAAGQTYVIADEGAPSWQDVFTELARLLGAKPPRFSLPGWLSEAAGRTVEQGYGLAAPKLEPPLTRYRGALMRRDIHFSLQAARTELGYAPRFSWQEGLKQTVQALGNAS